LSQRGCEVSRADAEKLLPWVQGISVFGSEGARGRDALNIGEQKASGGERDDPLHIAQPQRRELRRGEARRNLSRYCHPKRGQPKHGCSNDR
jgi:hypothetical protein